MGAVKVEDVLALAVRADAWGQKWLADRLYEVAGDLFPLRGCDSIASGVLAADRLGVMAGADAGTVS